ncbi:MAG: HlyC/CorC family transporter [Deltaproteobacteria bacterium]|nr:HlyC/CorC family transporter [Deltaproteobacteria bacterium]
MSLSTGLLLLLGCIVTQGFFSGSEISLVAADRLLLRSRAEEGDAGAGRALALLDRPTRLVSTCLIGTAIASVGGTTVLTVLLADLVGQPGLWVALLYPPVTVLLCEMIPKSAFQQRATTAAPLVAPVISAVATVLRPALWLIERFTRLVTSALGVKDDHDAGVRREDIQLLLDTSPTGDIHAEEREMILRVFNFSETEVQDAMRPLIEVVAVPETATVDEAAALAVEHGFSRLPVYRKRVDRIVGMVNHADLMFSNDGQSPVQKVMHEVLYVPETKRVDQLFLELRRKRQRIAIVLDEYGGATGLISIEDILEEIVGDIEDEFDRRRPLLRKSGEGEWTLSGRVETEQLLAATEFDLPEGDYETIAGFLLARLGHVPTVGEKLVYDGWTITVTKANERAILEVTVAAPPRPSAAR